MRVRTQFSTSALIQTLAAVTAMLLGETAYAQSQAELDESAPVARPHRLVANTGIDGLRPGEAFSQAPALTESAEAVLASCSSSVLPSDGGTSGNTRAPNPRYRGGRAVYLITASELAAAGIPAGATVTAIGWRYATAPGVVTTGTLQVFLENTADTTNLKGSSFASATSTMTLVHNAATTLPNQTAPFDIPLSLGGIFSYSGGGIYVAFDWRYPAGTLSTTAVVSCNITLAGGLAASQTTGAPPAPDSLTASNFRPETRLTATAADNEASVDYVIALGALPRDLVGPQVFQAVVTNRSGVALNNLPVTLDITGANTFTDTQTVTTLAACGGQAVVTFAAAPVGVLGADTVTASIPPDASTANNSKSRPLDITLDRYSYKHPGTIASGGVGSSVGTGAFVAKFTTTAATTVTAATLEFFIASATTYRVAIYADSGSGTPGAPLYVDAADRTVAAGGPVTIALPSPVPVGVGNFFVGIHQTNATNANCSYDTETPIRTGTFYYAAPLPVSAWNDFAPFSPFKLNIGVILDPCGSLGTGSPCDDGNVCTTNDTCQTGVCVGGSPLNCDDANACTADTCNPATGCAHSTIVCNDGNACTADTCNPATGCVYTSINDASVDHVIALGALPRDLVGPQVYQAVVTNRGGGVLNNLPVTLDITGANTFTDTQTVATLAACGGQAVVTFAAAPVGVLGADTVTASVPPDDVNVNNSRSRPLGITLDRYSFKHPGTAPAGGVGFSGQAGALVAKFTVTAATSVTAATLEFFGASATTYRVAIYADSGSGTPGAPLYVDAANRTVAAGGPVTIALPSPVPVGVGNFFVGIHQTNTTHANYSYDTETPIRAGTFYYGLPVPVTAWFDFSPGTTFKLNIGVILNPCAGGTGNACDDGSACTTNDTCAGGVCVAGSPLNCDDANVCTADVCDAATGCVHTNISGGCDDSIACTIADSCTGGVCVGTSTGPPSEVDDGVRLTKSGGNTLITWNPTGSALSDVVRGQLSGLPVGPGAGDEVCLEDNLGGAFATDPENPAAGSGFWYLVRGSSFCGDGPYGFQGLQGLPSTPRVTTTCAAFCGGAGLCDDSNACTVDSCNQATGQCEHTINLTDSDGDRLADCVETNTGIYVSSTNTGTNPNSPDTDGDAIQDGDEVLGTLAGLNLPAMGASPLKKNILLEYDWFDDNNDSGTCAAHTHRPTQAMLDRTSAAFAAAPVANPDGTTGVTLIHDYGQGGPFTGGNFVADADGVIAGGVNSADFQAIKAANFAGNRQGYVHYVLLPHRYNLTSDSSGQAELPGNDLIVSLYCFSGTTNTANTIMHELGHNLFLRHGGSTNCNWMPNYNSVMNYRYQFPGIDSDASCNAIGSNGETNILSYSIGSRLALNENALNETLGVCGGPAIDWNGNSVIENPVVYDLNRQGTSPFDLPDPDQTILCGATLSTLNDYNDWASLVFTGLTDGDRAQPLVRALIDCDNPTLPRIVAPEWMP